MVSRPEHARKPEFGVLHFSKKSTETDRESVRLARFFDEMKGAGVKDVLLPSKPRLDAPIEVKSAVKKSKNQKKMSNWKIEELLNCVCEPGTCAPC